MTCSHSVRARTLAHTHTHTHLPVSLPGGEVTRSLSCLPAPLFLITATHLSFCSVSCDPVKPLREVKVLTPAVSGSPLCLISGARGLRLPPLPTVPTFPCSSPSPSLSHLLSQDWGLLGPHPPIPGSLQGGKSAVFFLYLNIYGCQALFGEPQTYPTPSSFRNLWFGFVSLTLQEPFPILS